SNFSTALIKPRLPSCIRSRNWFLPLRRKGKKRKGGRRIWRASKRKGSFYQMRPSGKRSRILTRAARVEVNH
ncbi:MAG TPA: hypothetical protein PK955_03900, partial [Methanoregulaceae archaeon]|nr:hypothetical protein [Methanoregulaceae archaeon]